MSTSEKKAIITLTIENVEGMPSLDRLSEITSALSYISGGNGKVKKLDLQDNHAVIVVEELHPSGWKDRQYLDHHFLTDMDDDDGADNEDFTPVDYEDDVEEEGDEDKNC